MASSNNTSFFLPREEFVKVHEDDLLDFAKLQALIAQMEAEKKQLQEKVFI